MALRLGGLLLVVVLVGSACASASTTSEPAQAVTCSELADIAIARQQTTIDRADSFTPEQFAELLDDPSSLVTSELLDDGAAILDRSRQLGCGEDELLATFCSRFDRVRAKTFAGETALEGTRAAQCGSPTTPASEDDLSVEIGARLDPEALPHPCDLLKSSDIREALPVLTEELREEQRDAETCSWVIDAGLDTWSVDVQLDDGNPGYVWADVLSVAERNFGLCRDLDSIPGLSQGIQCGDDGHYVLYWEDNIVRGRQVGVGLEVVVGDSRGWEIPADVRPIAAEAARVLAELTATRATAYTGTPYVAPMLPQRASDELYIENAIRTLGESSATLRIRDDAYESGETMVIDVEIEAGAFSGGLKSGGFSLDDIDVVGVFQDLDVLTLSLPAGSVTASVVEEQVVVEAIGGDCKTSWKSIGECSPWDQLMLSTDFYAGALEYALRGSASGFVTLFYSDFVKTFARVTTGDAPEGPAFSVENPNVRIQVFGFGNLGSDPVDGIRIRVPVRLGGEGTAEINVHVAFEISGLGGFTTNNALVQFEPVVITVSDGG